MADHIRNWPPRALNEPDAAYYVSLSVATLRNEVEAGRAPRPFWLTPGRKAYLRDDLDAYLDRKAGRVAASAHENDWQRLFDQDGPRGSAIR